MVDRLLVKPGIEKRLEASIETATKLANGLVLIAVVNGEERLYSQKLACPECGTSVPQLEPRSFSFNSPFGACERCQGLGSLWMFDPDKIIVDRAKPLLDGGLAPELGSPPIEMDDREPGPQAPDQARHALSQAQPASDRDLLLEGDNGLRRHPGAC